MAHYDRADGAANGWRLAYGVVAKGWLAAWVRLADSRIPTIDAMLGWQLTVLGW